MKHTVRLTVSALALGGALGACTAGNGKPYAHESVRHPTAAERLFGASPGEPVAASNGSTASGSLVTAPAMAAPAPAVDPVVNPGVDPVLKPGAVPQPVAMVAPSDARFVQDLTAGSVVEIELGRLAYVRAQSPEVRAFARQMLIDHRDMVVKLDNFALERGHLVNWTIPQERAATIARLRSLDDASFDRAYMAEMVKAHEHVVQVLQVQAGSGRETAPIAVEALPVVQHHLEMAQQVHAAL